MWLTIVHIYLISCIPALLFFLMTAWEDIQCLRGKKKPCSKFGYNWKMPITSLTPVFTALMLVPVVNLYTGWFIVGGMIVVGISDWFKK